MTLTTFLLLLEATLLLVRCEAFVVLSTSNQRHGKFGALSHFDLFSSGVGSLAATGSSGGSGGNSGGSSDNAFMESLRARMVELESAESELEEKWRSASASTRVAAALPDWVRRIHLSEYPLVACGSSSGNVFVADLEKGEVIARSNGEEDKEELPNIQPILRMLYSGYDGGGTLAIAMHKSLICSSGRQGSVQVWRVDGTNLISQGSMQILEGVLVTCLVLDDEYLWVGRIDGKIQAFAHQSTDLPLTLQTKPEFEWNLESPVLSMSLSPELGYGVASTSEGSINIFSLDDDSVDVIYWYPPLDAGIIRQSGQSYVLSTALVPTKDDGCLVACGATDGSIHVRALSWTNGMLNEEKPWLKAKDDGINQCRPRHQGPAKCLASPCPGLLLSAGQDGSMRLWDVSSVTEEPKYLYQFMGYKVWIGSIWSDGKRLVSDGADNTIVVHDFEAGGE